MRLGFKIAARFLFSSKMQTLLIVLGIAIGVSVQVFIGSLISGLQVSLIDKTVGNSSQITVYSDGFDKLIDDYMTKINQINSSIDGIKKVNPAIDEAAFVEKDKETAPILLRGLDLNQNSIYHLSDRLVEGRLPNKLNEVVVGINLQEELGLQVGAPLQVLTPKGDSQEVTIVGFYDLKVTSINKSWVITTLGTVQNIFKTGDKVTSIEMQVNDVFQANTLGDKIKGLLNDDSLRIDNWKDSNQELLSGLQGQSTSSLMIQVFVLIAVVLGIASVLAITVLQKSKQLGILKAMGITDLHASLIFLFEGLILGLIGAVLGILFGLGLSLSFTKFALNPDGTPVVNLYIDPQFITISGVIAVLSATLASLIPARRSAKLNPIEVIKNG